jgi:hypothetical protein
MRPSPTCMSDSASSMAFSRPLPEPKPAVFWLLSALCTHTNVLYKTDLR